MKKIMALALALVMVLGTLTACGGGNATTAKVITINLTEEQYAFGVDKDQPELLEDVNAFIKKSKTMVHLMQSATNTSAMALQRLLLLPNSTKAKTS